MFSSQSAVESYWMFVGFQFSIDEKVLRAVARSFLTHKQGNNFLNNEKQPNPSVENGRL